MNEELHERIKSVIETERVTLFMKGTPQFVMCGNSERALQALPLGATRLSALSWRISRGG